jgi:hypothetical protein
VGYAAAVASHLVTLEPKTRHGGLLSPTPTMRAGSIQKAETILLEARELHAQRVHLIGL